MAEPVWRADEAVDGFEATTFDLGADSEGPLSATLVRRRAVGSNGRAVLYLHGYNDYFFQAHTAQEFVRRGWSFYALDLRKHGRSLRPYQTPNDCRDLHEYFEEITRAIDVITDAGDGEWLLLMAHSTGALTGPLYLTDGPRRDRVNAAVLNSPFLDFNLPQPLKSLVPVVSAVGRWLPAREVGGVSSGYGVTIHASQRGEWDYNLAWKPLTGFPVHAGWLRAIHRAHGQVQAGLDIEQPILLLRSARSAGPGAGPDEASSADVVLDVQHMVRYGPRLGRDVRLVALDGAVHDVTLSALPVRSQAFSVIFGWLPK
ncbi:MAG: alpha/beta hydrolase fold protein [Acidimicrobiia bacterium]|nr:alpha/beta hydrolase fold protein [Acidimicrobiia bacterium]